MEARIVEVARYAELKIGFARGPRPVSGQCNMDTNIDSKKSCYTDGTENQLLCSTSASTSSDASV